MDLRQVFAANLRRLRHAKGLFQEELAYEAGGTFVGLGIIGKLAKVLDIEAAEFLKSPPKKAQKKSS